MERRSSIVRRIGTSILVMVLVFFVSTATPAPVHAAVTCSSSAAAQNGISVAPSHGQAFYVDTGASPKLDAGYMGYRVVNSTGSTKSNLWVEVSSFAGGVVTLANPDDSMMQLTSLSNNASSTAYFLLKATGATTQAQSHTVRVYNGKPDLSGSSLLYECSYSFSKVQETIKAAANKVTDNTGDSIAITTSSAAPELGQALTITIEGQTGTVGNGSTPDGSIVWLTPAAVSSWPTRALRLENVSVVFDTNRNWNTTGDQVMYTNQLLISNAKSAISNSEYRATYTFRVIGKPLSTVTAVPLAQIASGSQIKHADTTATGATLDLSFSSLSINAVLTKTVTATSSLTTVTCGVSCTVPGGTNGMTYAAVPYRLRATTSTSTIAKIDEVVDTPPSGVIFKPNSATITDVGRTAVAISDPVYLSSEALSVPRPYHFVGPFTFNSATSSSLDYTMWVPIGAYINTGYAMLGDTKIGATASAMSQVTVTSDGSATITAATSTENFPVIVTTQPVTGITSTGATLNGVVDPNGTSTLTGTFQYGTSPTLSGATTVTATTPSSGTLNGLTNPTITSVTLSGLSVNTTYYYRAVAGDTQGDILSFQTLAVQATPTVSAQAASDVTLTQATLNGTINPNLTSVTAIQFVYGTSSSLSSGNTTVTLDDGTGVTLTAGGSSAQLFSTTTGALTGGATYYFKVRACTASSGTYPSITCSASVESSILSFVATGAPTASTTAATSVGASVATLNGVVKANFATTTASFVYGTSSSLTTGTSSVSAGTVTGSASTTVSASITGLAPATTYYFRVLGTNGGGTTNGTILSFLTSAVNRTLSIDSNSYTSTYSYADTAPTLVATPSVGTGTLTYISTTPDICTINSSSGAVTFVGTGTCTLGATIAASGSYTDASAPSISFTITAATRTLAFDAESYDSSYAFNDVAPTVFASPSAGNGVVTYTSNTTSVCTVDEGSGVVSFVSTGTCTLVASIEASGVYGSADAEPISFSVTTGARTLSIDVASYDDFYLMSDPEPTLTTTLSAGGGAISFTSHTTDVCTVDSTSGAVSFVSAGTCRISAHADAATPYDSADSDDISITLSSANRTLTISPGSYTATYAFDAIAPTLSALPSVGTGTISYESLTSDVCTVDSVSGVTTFVSIGTCRIRAAITADETYSDTQSPSILFEITALTRTLTISPSSYDDTYLITDDEPTLTSNPSAGSGTKTYTSETTSVCTVHPTTGAVSFASTGTCTIHAAIAAQGVYLDATSPSVSFEISEEPAPEPLSRALTIDADSYDTSYVLTDAAPALSATPSAGLGTISFASETTGVCTVTTNGAVSFVAEGTCTIHASITADDTYLEAVSSSISFAITEDFDPGPIDLLTRTLTIDADSYNASYLTTDDEPVLSTVVSAGAGTVSYTSETTGVCTVSSDGTVSFVGEGTCTIHASITSDDTYIAATSAAISFDVEEPSTSPRSHGNGNSKIKGCTDATAKNYSKRAKQNDGSCVYASSEKTTNTTAATHAAPQATKAGIHETVPTSPSVEPSVAPRTCAPYLTRFIRLGDANDPEEVRKLQTFLNTHEGEYLVVDGVYKAGDAEAVKRFQHKYSEVLAFWNITEPTGYVYISTQKAINTMYCEDTMQIACPFFTKYVQEGDKNSEVVKIKTFLNATQGTSLDMQTDLFDASVTKAVQEFQQKYVQKVLTPWNISAPTGRWYESTQKAANDLVGCFHPIRLDNGTVLE